MIKELIKIANHLDSMGLKIEADAVDNLIKTAVAKQRFVQDLIQKYGEKVIKTDLGLISRYYEMAGLKSIDTMSEEYGDLIRSLPDSWQDVKSLMESKISNLSVDATATKNNLMSLGLKEEDLINKDVRSWLEDRYIKNIGSEVHPLSDTLQTIKEYVAIKDPLIKKIQVNDELKKELEAKGFSEEMLADPLKLSADDMVFIIGQYKYGGKTTIRTVGVEISPEENIGKVGEWNIWLPKTQETSAKIAGYDDVTKEPHTDWCTNRTKGSNLFYHYISRNNVISFLFYIIKDNPSSENDWLSVGFIGSEDEGLGSIKPIFDDQDGGMTVSRYNKGLVERDFEKILGNKYQVIFDIIKKKIKDLNGKNPATEALKQYAKDISLFKKEYWNKSEEEREDFSDIILELNPDGEVASMAKASAHPFEFLKNFTGNKIDKPYFHMAATNCAKTDSANFLESFSDRDWAVPYRKLAAEALINHEASFEFLNSLNSAADLSWAKEYIDRACRESIKISSFSFLRDFRNLEFAKPHVESLISDILSNGSRDELFSIVEMTVDDFRNGNILAKYKDNLFEKLAESYPEWFLNVTIMNSFPEYFSYNSDEWTGSCEILKKPESKKHFRELAKDYIRVALNNFKGDAISFLSYEPDFLPYVKDIIRDEIKNDPLFIFNFSRITYPLIGKFLSSISPKERAEIITAAIRSMGSANFIIDYAETFDGDKEAASYIDLAINIISESPKDAVSLLKQLDGHSSNKSYFSAMINVAHNLLNKDPAYFIQNLGDCKFCTEPLAELDGRSFMDIAKDMIKTSSDKILNLCSALIKIGLIKEARYIINL